MLTNILEYLEATAARLPQKVAFSDGAGSLTFGELQRAAKSAGSRIAAMGYRREPVMIMMDRHPNVLAAFLGVVYAGCFYVPINLDMRRSGYIQLAPHNCRQVKLQPRLGALAGTGAYSMRYATADEKTF